MAALIIAIFPQNSSRGNWEEQQDRTDPNSRFELARKPAWLLAFRQFGLPKWKHDFECGPFNHLGTSPNLCYIPGPDPPTNSAGGNREEQQDRTSNIIQFELGWNPHGSKGFSRLALRIGNLISNHYTNLDDDGKSGTIAVTTEPQNTPLKVAVRWLLSL